MVTYGPWLQGGDYQRVPGGGYLQDDQRLTNRWTSVSTSEPRIGQSAAYLKVLEMVNASADSGWPGDGGPYTLPGPWVSTLNHPLLFEMDVTGGAGPGDFIYQCQRRFAPYSFTAWNPATEAGPWPTPANANPLIPFAEWPAGALGYEYEQPHATVLSATVHIHYVGVDFDDSHGATTMHDGDGVQQVRQATGVYEASAEGVNISDPDRMDMLVGFDGRETLHNGQLLDETPSFRNMDITRDVSVTPGGRPHDGHIVVMGSYRVDRVPTMNMATDERGFGMGAVIFPTCTYTFRPARHRFIFERAQGLPPVRVFPRDDGLAASAGPRVWPPPKSQQGGSRVGPGSYW